MTRNSTRTTRVVGGLLAGAVLLTGCSDSGNTSDAGASSGSSAAENSAGETAAFNNADVNFVQQMIPHHRGALTMAELAEGRAKDPRVLDLAYGIANAQQPEIDTMIGWLEEWGEPVPGESDESMEGMDHGSDDKGGMDMGSMTEEDMTALESASGSEFDRMFLEMMIEHHRGAVEMAQQQIGDGNYPDALIMAQNIVTSQTAEIEIMNALLAELDG